jgi:hypothetical protein
MVFTNRGVACVPVLMLLPLAPAFAEVSFNRDIRPIMADTCFRCHGPDKSSRMAGMRLDIRDEALKPTASGALPIVPGDPDRSAIIQRIFAAQPARVMPPKYVHKDLSPAQKDTIRRWVAEGAKYEGHWAYQPLARPSVPANTGAHNPIDAFVLARLEREGLHASAEADRRTLIRRVTLDLTGILPTPGEVDAFLADKSEDAYEKVVDRLLASPRYAEMQALHWLDAVRYADTCGFHGDNLFPAWPYRDYVLRAFRDNKPFDVFTREQLAGDLIADAGMEQKVASAFNRLNRTSAEGGLQPKEYLAKYAADRVRTISAVWLGSTLGCAECHDHKFDPFLSRDFYSLKAFFADIRETGLVPDRGIKAWGSQMPLPGAEQQEKLAKLNQSLAAIRGNLKDQDAAVAAHQKELEGALLAAYKSDALSWRYQRPISAAATNGVLLKIYNDEPIETSEYTGASLISGRKPGNGLVIASGPNPDNSTYTVRFKPGAGTWTALGLEVVQDESLPGIRYSRGSDRLVVTEVEAELGGRKLPFVLANTNQGVQSSSYPAMGAIDGDAKTAWGVDTYGDNANLFLALRFAQPLTTSADAAVTVRIHQDSESRRATVGRFRLALSDARYSWPTASDLKGRERERRANAALNKDITDKPLEESEVHDGLPLNLVKVLHKAPDERSEEDAALVLNHLRWASPDLQAGLAEEARLAAELSRLDASIPRVVITQATEPEDTRILPRGNWQDDSGEIVEPAIPVRFGKLETGGHRATRLDLANWLVSPANPLTPRVFVNRMWRQFFGTGISKMLDDLGSQGEWPVHPELLDWLAAEFVHPEFDAGGAHDWDVRHVIRTIVTSRTYRQSSVSNPQLDERDPDNRLLARQSRFRVDAEIVRDIALSASGLLVNKFGGPSVRPYQPDGYLAALNFPKREYSAGHGEDLYRRGLYTVWQRSFLHPSLLTFDAPTREECTINRVNSNTPLQALVLLNDPIYVEAARVFAQSLLAAPRASVAARIDAAFLRTLDRTPTAEERDILEQLYRDSLRQFRAEPAEAKQLIHVGEAPSAPRANPAELAALTAVTRAILNLHETITRN